MKKLLFIFVIFLLSTATNAQTGFAIPADSGSVEIPFIRSNNLIIIPISFNKNVTLKFILDTSVEYSILTEKSVGDELGMNYVRKISLGSMNGEPSFGYSANGVQLSIGAATTGSSHPMLVLENDFMNLSNLARTKVDGLIGYDLFGSFVVEINHSKNLLTLHPREKFETPRGYDELPIEVVARKSFLPVDIVFENWEEETKKFQIKTGATHTILFNSDSNLFHLPARKLEIPLGMGPNGGIEGYVGRVRELTIGNNEFEDVIASFTKSEIGTSKETGSIGMGVLSRFDLAFDYLNQKMYLRKNRDASKSFEYDLSGMKIDLDIGSSVFRVTHIIDNSPAAKAGIKEGDQILSVQGERLTNENFNDVLSVFLEKEGKRVKLQINQGGEIKEVAFTLARLI